MSASDITVRILHGIQQSLAEMNGRFDGIDARFERIDARFERIDARFERIDARFDTVDARLESLERNTAATTELLGLMHDRLSFFERSATVAQEGRARLEDRVDVVEARLERLEAPPSSSP